MKSYILSAYSKDTFNYYIAGKCPPLKNIFFISRGLINIGKKFLNY